MLQPGDTFGRYEIQRRLARGGMGTVYVAHDPILGRLVALKMFAGDLDAVDAAQNFAREARAAANLSHPNIVTIHDFGEVSSQPFIVMEYVQGDTLGVLIRKKEPLPLAKRLRLMQELCAGVAYAHSFDVIHRDIKPSNLIVDRSGRLKILDFGIARMLGSSMSKASALIGTPGYMAPEQIRGGEVDRRSDVFSIGVVCYELLSHAEAFAGDSMPAITHRILTEEPVSLAGLVPKIPEDLIGIVERALKKDVTHRFADAESFGSAIAQVLRQVEANDDWGASAPTLPGASGPPNRGSGPHPGTDRSPTPVSGSGRIVREEIRRRRTSQIDASLERARVLLHAGDLDEALEACVQALTLDDTHAAALDTEQTIRAAMSKRRAGVLVCKAREELGRGSLTSAQVLLAEARDLDPEAIDVRKLDLDLRLARVAQEQARQRAHAFARMLDAARASWDRGDLESAVAGARAALEMDPTSEAARHLELEATRRLREPARRENEDDIVAPTIVSSGRRTPSPAPPPKAVPDAAQLLQPAPSKLIQPSPWLQLLTRLRAGVKTLRGLASRAGRGVSATASAKVSKLVHRAKGATAQSGGTPTSDATVIRRPNENARREETIPDQKGIVSTQPKPLWADRRVLWALGGTVAVVLALFAFLRPATDVPIVRGSVLVDAIPWATVTAIVAEDGTPQALPEDASTPVSLELPVGVYRITMASPPPESSSQEVQVTVQDGQVASVSNVQFAAPSPEDYFEPYLASGEAAVSQSGSGPQAVR